MAYQALLPHLTRRQIGDEINHPRSDRGSEEHLRRCRHHAIKRAAERYGLIFTEQDVMEHEQMIRLGLAKEIGRGGYGYLYEIQGEHRPYYPVYLRDIDAIATYLRAPHEWTGSMRRAR